MKKLLSLLWAILLPSLAVFAQEPTPAATPETKINPDLEKKAFKLLERVATDAHYLKLAENRVFVSGLTADLLWTRDEKRARLLFRDAANDIIVAFGEARDTKSPGWNESFYNTTQVRRGLLQTVARRDPELALELLRNTRPAKNDDTMSALMDGFSNQERSLEQSLAIAVAARDPQRALEIARESLNQGVSMSALEFIRKLQDKNEEAAAQFAGDVIQKLKTENITRNAEAAIVAPLLLQQLAGVSGSGFMFGSDAPPKNTKPPKIDEKQLRDLAEVVVNAALSPSPLIGGISLGLKPLLPTIEKLLPERAPEVRKKVTEMEKALPPEMRRMMNAVNTSGDKPPAAAFDSAADIPGEMRTELRRRAVQKMTGEGQAERARQLINEKTEGREREDLLAFLNKERAAQAIRDGQFEEAKKIAAGMLVSGERAAVFAKLALGAHAKKDEAMAGKTLDEALTAVPRYPESYEDLRNLAEVARACAVIKPEATFDLLEPTIGLLDELLTASALLEKFSRSTSAFRNGEMRFSNGLNSLGPIASYSPELGLLAAHNFGRTQTLIDRFRRDDARLLARLLLVQSILAGKFGFGSERDNPFVIIGGE